jgi:predicted Zn-dependent protease
MQSALDFARRAWGVDAGEAISLTLEPLAVCTASDRHEIALTQVTDITTTMVFDDGSPSTVTHRFTYIIRINANCDWSKLHLIAAMTHEMGHVLLGAAYHSRDKRSIMYPEVRDRGQSIMPADRARLAALLAANAGAGIALP